MGEFKMLEILQKDCDTSLAVSGEVLSFLATVKKCDYELNTRSHLVNVQYTDHVRFR